MGKNMQNLDEGIQLILSEQKDRERKDYAGFFEIFSIELTEKLDNEEEGCGACGGGCEGCGYALSNFVSASKI
jgi:hypothetical protein